MLHLMDAFLVCPLLLLFTPLVAFHQWDVSVALGKRVNTFTSKKASDPSKNQHLECLLWRHWW